MKGPGGLTVAWVAMLVGRFDEVVGEDGGDQVMVWRRGKGFVIERYIYSYEERRRNMGGCGWVVYEYSSAALANTFCRDDWLVKYI